MLKAKLSRSELPFHLSCKNESNIFISFLFSSGLSVGGKILVNAGFISLDSNFAVNSEPQLNVQTDIDFSKENIVCLKLSQPNNVLVHEIEKNQIIPVVKHHVKTTKKLKYNIQGLTHFLNDKTNELCQLIELKSQQ